VRLLAPGAGIVVSRDAEAGSTVVAGQAVLRLIEPSSLWVKVRFDQGRSAGLAPGLPAQIVLRANPGTPVSGKVVRVEAISDSVTEERVAQVAFGRLPAGVSVGELAEVTLALPPPPPALLVPNASIQRRVAPSAGQAREQATVWLLDGNALRLAPVRLGPSGLDGRVQVLDGLKAGDRIVVYSEKALAAGARIQVVDRLTARAP
jgi:HlyD family secretion protein